jgi:hypothetical protein
VPNYIVSTRFQRTIEAPGKTEAFKAMLSEVTRFADEHMEGWAMSDLDIWKRSDKDDQEDEG